MRAPTGGCTAPHVVLPRCWSSTQRQTSEASFVDPKTDKPSFIEGAGAEGNKYLGICAVPDRRLCCAPNNATPVLVVDPKIDKLSFLEGAGAVGSKCGGICAGSDGRLYCL